MKKLLVAPPKKMKRNRKQIDFRNKLFQKIPKQFLSRQKQLQKTFEFFYCSYVTMTKIVSLRFFPSWVGPLETKFIN